MIFLIFCIFLGVREELVKIVIKGFLVFVGIGLL